MVKSRERLYLIVIITSLMLLTYISSFSQTDISIQSTLSPSSFPEIVYNYNYTFTKQYFTAELDLELDTFNVLTMFFFTSGEKTNSYGIDVIFKIEQTEIRFTIEKLFQDTLNYNFSQIFSFPEAFTGKKKITITCEAQTSHFYQSGSLHITSQTTIEKILPQQLTATPSSLPLFPNWIKFMGYSIATRTRSVSAIFNNSLNYDKLNLSLSFLANDFSALEQYFNVEINNQIVCTQEFQENEYTSTSFLSKLNSGMNLLEIHFSVAMCVDEIILSNIHLTINGLNNQDILPHNAYDWYEWNNKEFDHSFDLSVLKSQVSNPEQIVEVQVNYGCIGSVIHPAIRYNIYVGINTVESGEIGEGNQKNSSQTITTKFPTTDNSEPITFRIQGAATGLGYFYILNTSFITSEELPKLHENDTLERTVIETESHVTPSFFSLDLTYTDFFNSTLDSYHHLFNISMSFSLTNEFGVAIREIRVLMKFDLIVVFDKQFSYDKLIVLQKQQILYSQVYRVKLI